MKLDIIGTNLANYGTTLSTHDFIPAVHAYILI